MAKIKVIHGDAFDYSFTADLMLTDPPFDMSAERLISIINCYNVEHLVLIATMRQLWDLSPPATAAGWFFSFDSVLDGVMPKKSMSEQEPNYVHSNVVYLRKKGVKSIFNRKLRQRTDVFEANGYWPSIFYAPRERVADHGMAKNSDSITDLLGSFKIESVIDIFAGSGTTGIAAHELGLDCTLIDIDENNIETIKATLKLVGARYE